MRHIGSVGSIWRSTSCSIVSRLSVDNRSILDRYIDRYIDSTPPLVHVNHMIRKKITYMMRSKILFWQKSTTVEPVLSNTILSGRLSKSQNFFPLITVNFPLSSGGGHP